MAQTDTFNHSRLILIGVLGAILVYFFVVGGQLLTYWYEEQQAETKVYSTLGDELHTVRAANETRLNGYRWVDRQAGTVQLDIERAKALVVEEVTREGSASQQ